MFASGPVTVASRHCHFWRSYVSRPPGDYGVSSRQRPTVIREVKVVQTVKSGTYLYRYSHAAETVPRRSPPWSAHTPKIGGAEKTIVKMSANCGRDFAAIPASNGPISMRAGAVEPHVLGVSLTFPQILLCNSDMPDYWDTVVDSPPERKRWLQEREIKERWWGTYKSWLYKMTTVEKDTSVSRNFHQYAFNFDRFVRSYLQWTIFHKEVPCPGLPQFEASIDVSIPVTDSICKRLLCIQQVRPILGFVPSALRIYSAKWCMSAVPTFLAYSKADLGFCFQSKPRTRPVHDPRQSDSLVWSAMFASFGFLGLYYPGLLTVG
ncbi:hypothetical protein C8R46DRAFT_1294302 [Mycena filopes]|nr:hypothetical protein C8R46DRAFT_1294302 [Mycena filopes]